mmetsp:Transcript_54383/g.126920  ORF Transcript_54383/g.126920 Transcript_54383/m.126920 type:complete len:180 (+) Transcript_54383:830-1369(+)
MLGAQAPKGDDVGAPTFDACAACPNGDDPAAAARPTGAPPKGDTTLEPEPAGWEALLPENGLAVLEVAAPNGLEPTGPPALIPPKGDWPFATGVAPATPELPKGDVPMAAVPLKGEPLQGAPGENGDCPALVAPPPPNGDDATTDEVANGESTIARATSCQLRAAYIFISHIAVTSPAS